MMKVSRRVGASGALGLAAVVWLCPVRASASAHADEDQWKRPVGTQRPPPPKWRSERTDSRLVIAVSPLIGPHAFGNQQCDGAQRLCDRAGRFFGVGGTLELRARLHKVLYAHARFLGVGNAISHKPVFKGLVAPGLGLGAYGRLAFIRLEYLFYVPLGGEGCETLRSNGARACDDFEVPFDTVEAGEATWSASAVLLSGGVRYRLRPRMVGELWGGLVVGPQEERVVAQLEPETRILRSFVMGLGLAFDVAR